jgi:hypothetical protein
MISDEFSEYYRDHLDGIYDCVDRIVLNAYFPLAQSGGGFRVWWRRLHGGEGDLDNAHLMRYAGRFARRIRAYASKRGIPLIECQRGERKHEVAGRYLPKDPAFRGLFCILAGRAPAPVRDIRRCSNGQPHIARKAPQPYVNHYSFHIMDRQWGHLTIKLCPHPPFNAQIMLNGHEYVARQASRRNIPFAKEGNCFTQVSDAADLSRVADTMSAGSAVGRLVQVCERWIYSACLVFTLDLAEQERCGFRYAYSVYQCEYSRNLLFTRGRTMEKVFQGLIDRIRAPLDIKTVKTIFGYKNRPYRRDAHGKLPRFEVSVERPVYDLTVFKVHFGKVTVKIYSKGKRVLRIEVIVHNTRDLRCGRRIDAFPQIVASLKAILERFLSVLRSVDLSFLDDQTLETWPLPSKVGSTRVAGVDINQRRMRAVMEAVIARSANPQGFTASQIAGRVREILGVPETGYHSRQASYDLKKLRGKCLVHKIADSRRYHTTPDGLSAMVAFLVLRDKVLIPLLAGRGKRKTGRKPRNRSRIDLHYENIQIAMQELFETLGIAA